MLSFQDLDFFFLPKFVLDFLSHYCIPRYSLIEERTASFGKARWSCRLASIWLTSAPASLTWASFES